MFKNTLYFYLKNDLEVLKVWSSKPQIDDEVRPQPQPHQQQQQQQQKQQLTLRVCLRTRAFSPVAILSE